MKNQRIVVITLLVILLSSTTAIFANTVSTGEVTDVTWLFDYSGPSNGLGLYAFGSGPTCTTTAATYLQWKLTSIPLDTKVNYVKVSLNMSNPTGIQPGTQLGIYEISDSWTEGTNSQALPAPPALGTPLMTITAPNAAGVIVFEGTGIANDLVTYVNNQVKSIGNGGTGDRTVSFAVMFAVDCDPNSDSTYNFEDREGTLGTGSGGPGLLLTSTDANAVTLSTFTTDSAAPTWPLYTGLGALALIAAAGVALSRRRAALR